MDLFTYLQDTFGVLATESELNEIKFLVLGEERYIAESNGAKPIVRGSFCGCNTINYGYCIPVCYACNKPVKVVAK